MTARAALQGRGQLATLVAVLLVGLNLRAGIAAVGPVVPALRADLDAGPAAVSLLTSLPVLCFALAAPLASRAGARLGLDRAIALGLCLLVVGSVVRVAGGLEVLLVGTLLVGVGMTLGNVLVPPVLKRGLRAAAGTATGAFTASLTAGAALAAAGTVPLALVAGWRAGLALWTGLAVLALVVWVVSSPGPSLRGDPGNAGAGRRTTTRGLAGRPVAWALACLLGTQSAAFFAVTAWLPTLLVERAGTTLAVAGSAAALFQVLGVAGTLTVPALLRAGSGQRALALLVSAAWTVGVVGLLVLPAGWLAWVTVLGLAQGAGISLALTLVVLRAADADVARDLSAFVQAVGYVIGAAGPLVLGALAGLTGTWDVPLTALAVVCVAMGVAGARAARDEVVAGWSDRRYRPVPSGGTP